MAKPLIHVPLDQEDLVELIEAIGSQIQWLNGRSAPDIQILKLDKLRNHLCQSHRELVNLTLQAS